VHGGQVRDDLNSADVRDATKADAEASIQVARQIIEHTKHVLKDNGLGHHA
jgi:hypothetical protein